MLLASIVHAQAPERLLRVEETKQSWPDAGKRWALVVGVDEYDDHQISSLRGAANDARALAEAFVKYGGFPQDQVIVLATGEAADHQPTRGNILVRLSNLVSLIPPDGLLLLSFAGHGMERGGQAFLLPSDARVSNSIRVLQQTALQVSEIESWIHDIGVKQVLLLLDACRNDPTAGRSDTPNLMTEAFRKSFDFDTRNSGIEAFATLYATKVGERAFEYAAKSHGYFTWAVVEGLEGKAANQNGEVTLGALLKYVQETVPKQVRIDLGAGKDQYPFADVRGYRADELVVAHTAPGGMGVEAARPVEAPEVTAARNREWDSVRGSSDVRALDGFRMKYPGTAQADMAGERISELQKQAAAAAEVTAALDKYGAAYSQRDVQQVKALNPSLGPKSLSEVARFFQFARSVKLDLTPVNPPAVNGDVASVTCKRGLSFTDETGSRKSVEDLVDVRLRRTAGGWVIDLLEPAAKQ